MTAIPSPRQQFFALMTMIRFCATSEPFSKGLGMVY